MAWLHTLATRARQLLPAGPASRLVMRTAPPALPQVHVDENTALTYSAVFACVRIIAETMGVLGVDVYQQLPGDRRRKLEDDPAAVLLGLNPNSEMGPMLFREVLTAHALLWGNGYGEIERDRMGRPVALWPIEPHRVTPIRNRNGKLLYRVQQPSGGTVVLEAAQVFHLRGLGYDGVQGYSVVALARDSIALGLTAERFGSQLFGSGGRPSGVLEFPGQLDPEGRVALREQWEGAYGGNRSGRVAVLEQGLKFTPLSIPPDDAQFLETRKLQVVEVCRWFRVPPHLVQDLERATFSNIEEQGIGFVQHTMLPWVRRHEQEAERKLTADPSRRVRYNLDTLLRGNVQARFQAYSIGRQWGWMSANDVRRLEGMDPVDGLDEYLRPLNMVDATEPAPAADAPAAAEPKAGEPPPQGELPAPSRHLPAAAGEALRSTLERVARIERDRIERRARQLGQDAGAFADWLDGFLEQHRAHVLEQVQPHARMLGAALGIEQDAVDAAVQRWAGQYVRAAADAVVTAWRCGNLDASACWQDRPRRYADALVEQLTDDHERTQD